MGIDAMAILLFFPETQFSRNYVDRVDSDPDGGERKEIAAEIQEQLPNSRKKTFFQELQPWSKISRDASFLQLLFRPWPTMVYPATIFSFLTFASTLGWLISVINTNASIFQAPPYSMSPAINGLINIPAFIGNLLGAYAGGALTDKFAERQARKNNGVFEPETRLIALIIPFVVVPAGLLM
jgi:hypothetical protein